MQSTKSSLRLRIWQLNDAAFIVECRNNPYLQRWFKQDKDLTLLDQETFMQEKAPKIGYYGFIIEVNGSPVGFTSLILDNKQGAEFGIGILPQYQKKGYATQAISQLCSLAFNEFRLKRVYGDVFVHNPALSFYLWRCGFNAYGVEKKAYYKKGDGFIDTVLIEQCRF